MARLIELGSQISNPEWGKDPKSRTIDERLSGCAINIDKTKGPTSHQVTSWIKDILGVRKAGHGGTLDPNVSGVLPIGVAKTARLLEALLYSDKGYVCIMHLHDKVNESEIREIIGEFQGEILQTPPVRSAVKRQLRTRTIHSIDILEIEEKDVLFNVLCEPGTYIRTLCNDIGEALGTGAHMADLRRTKSGIFNDKNIVTLHQLKDAFENYKESGEPGELERILLPYETLMEHLPRIKLKDSAVDAICQGAPVMIPGIAAVDDGISRGDIVGVYTLKGEGIGFGKVKLGTTDIVNLKSGIAAGMMCVTMERGTYPRGWKERKKRPK